MSVPHQKVSVIIPCLNEEYFIGKCLDSLIDTDYLINLIEIIVVDGHSEDRTIQIVKQYQKKYPFIKLLDNPKKFTPAALNKGIQAAQGDIIIRIDAHAVYPKEYIPQCIANLEKYNADNVGGIVKTFPVKNTLIAQSIAIALAHPFGVGPRGFRTARNNETPRAVDTVPFGCFRKKLFDEIGMYNEQLPKWHGRCNEDFELNSRIRMRGGKIILVPKIESFYFARGTLREFLIHNFNNGVLVTFPLGSDNADFSIRHLVPVFFVLFFVLFILLSVVSNVCCFIFLSVFGLYCFCTLYFSFKRAVTTRNLLYFFLMPGIFFSLHVSYGLGSVYGLLKALQQKYYARKQAALKI